MAAALIFVGGVIIEALIANSLFEQSETFGAMAWISTAVTVCGGSLIAAGGRDSSIRRRAAHLLVRPRCTARRREEMPAMKMIKHGSNNPAMDAARRGLAACALEATLAAGCAPVESAESSPGQPAVYGADDRLDVYADTDGWMRALARQSSVSLMRASVVNATAPRAGLLS